MTYILIVEDNPLHRIFIGVNLRARGYETKLVDRVEVALSHIEEQLPDLILTDYNLVGKSGLELIEELSSDPQTAQIPIILMSIFFDEVETTIQTTYSQVVEVMGKPFSLTTLLNTVQKYVPPTD